MNPHLGIYRRCELAFIRMELKQYELLPIEGKVLIRLKGNCFTQDELGDYFDMDKGRVARELLRLESRGLIVRTVNEKNRRQKMVKLTLAGEEQVHKMEEIFDQWETICYQGFSEEERLMYEKYIKRIAENVVAYRHKKGESTYGK